MKQMATERRIQYWFVCGILILQEWAMNVSNDNSSDPVANVTDHGANYDNGGRADVILFIFASCALGGKIYYSEYSCYCNR